MWNFAISQNVFVQKNACEMQYFDPIFEKIAIKMCPKELAKFSSFAKLFVRSIACEIISFVFLDPFREMNILFENFFVFFIKNLSPKPSQTYGEGGTCPFWPHLLFLFSPLFSYLLYIYPSHLFHPLSVFLLLFCFFYDIL